MLRFRLAFEIFPALSLAHRKGGIFLCQWAFQNSTHECPSSELWRTGNPGKTCLHMKPAFDGIRGGLIDDQTGAPFIYIIELADQPEGGGMVSTVILCSAMVRLPSPPLLLE
jgi:hypothetical protein